MVMDVILIVIFSSLNNQLSDVASFSKYVEFILENKILLFPIIGISMFVIIFKI